MLGNGRPAVSPDQQPVPIASVAKVMTAYLVLKHYPLGAGDSGRRFVVGQDDVVDTVSVASFVGEMNHTARAMGMSHTTYTDPSGHDDGTVSTALDQLRLAKDETLAAMMATRTYWLPVAGGLTNINPLLGHDGFVGSGSDEAAGGCLMFRAVWRTESGNRSLIGVVLGQRGDNLITAGLDAAKQLIDRLAPNAAPL